jgi:hypothetical protein
MRQIAPFAAALVSTLGLGAQQAPPPLDIATKFIKVMLTSTSQFGFACNDEALKAKLEEAGVSVGPGFKFAWGSSEPEVRALKAQNRFIICPNSDWLKSGASIAIVLEAGKPELYLHAANAKASGVTVPDAIGKIAKKL